MNIYFDTEFTGLHKNTTLISLGCVDENGRTFYAELTDYDESQMNDWIRENVIGNLLQTEYETFEITVGEHWRIRGNRTKIRDIFEAWLSAYDEVQFVSDVCHYDMVLLIDLFGDAFSLPKNVSPSCHDINQDIARHYGVSEREAFDMSREEILNNFGGILSEFQTGKHNALWDASVIRQIHEALVYAETEGEIGKLENKEQLKEIVLNELDAAGYFIQDYDSNVIQKNNPDWKPYSTKSFGEMLMDFAQYYNMSEENREYTVLEPGNCPTWRRGKPDETGTAYLLNFKDGSIACSTDYRVYDNCFYYEDGEQYEKARADDKNLRWLYVHKLNNLPKEF